MKKPALRGTAPLDAADAKAIKENFEIICGRRGEQNDLAGLESLLISNPPTQAQMEFLRKQLTILVKRLQE
jgi:hypothetical protein